MKKISYTLAVSCILFGLQSSLHAVTDVSCYPYAVTPFFDSGCCGLEVELSALYLKPRLNHFIWSQELTNHRANTQYFREKGHFQPHQLCWDWHVGYQLEAGYRLPCSDWRLSLGWTGFEARDSEQLRAQATVTGEFDATNFIENGTFITLPPVDIDLTNFSNRAGLVVVSDVEGEFKLTYNELSLIACRSSFLGKNLLFNPYTGLKALWLKEKVDAGANYTLTLDGNVGDGQTAYHYYNDYRAIGITAGFQASYLFFCQLALEGKLGYSLFYGSNRLRGENIFQEDDNDDAPFFNKDSYAFFIEGKEWCFIPQWELNLALTWYHPDPMDQGLFFASIGWEMRHLVKSFLAPPFNFENDALLGSSYDLTLSGLRLTLGFSF